MRPWTIVLALGATGCVASSADLVTACQAHDLAVRAVTPAVAEARLTQDEVDAVRASMDMADEACPTIRPVVVLRGVPS